MDVRNPEDMPTLEDFAMWMGELQINLKMAWKKINTLQNEIAKLKQDKKDDQNKG